jgi:hypothetical protein
VPYLLGGDVSERGRMKIHSMDLTGTTIHCVTIVQDDFILYFCAKGEKILWERKVLRARKDTMHMARRACLEQQRVMVREMLSSRNELDKLSSMEVVSEQNN